MKIIKNKSKLYLFVLLCVLFPINAKCSDESIYKKCNGYPRSVNQFNKFDDPYDIKGKCFFITISGPTQKIQWINSKTLIVFPYIDGLNPLVFIDKKEHIKMRNSAIVIGIDPIQYNNSYGEIVTPPSFEILKYIDSSVGEMGSGSLGEPRTPVKPSLVYPENELENNVSGNVDLFCEMTKNKDGFFSTKKCSPKNYINSNEYKDFLQSSLESAYHSEWSSDELKDIDINNNATIHYGFKIGD